MNIRWPVHLVFQILKLYTMDRSKNRPSFERVLLAGGILNMDGRRELDWMEELAAAHPTQTFRVGIRVNF